MKKYQVIGGQFSSIYYGESDSLQEAEQIANENKEYWDAWQGWHSPAIYDKRGVRERDHVIINYDMQVVPSRRVL
ncbi:MAG: hypothetical protein K6G65_06035 [Lachnospiraceae bacterium]|nr:hypothetical protein [Lachnospiraceae bacterium]